jgi:hypothetical protein
MSSSRFAVFPALGLLAGCLADEEPPLTTTETELQASCVNGIADAGEFCPDDAATILSTTVPLLAVTNRDFNLDGLPDLAAISTTRTYVLLKAPAGWGPLWTWNLPAAQLTDIGAGDFDNDGDPDIVVTDFANDNIKVYTNNGAGGFGIPTAWPVGNGPTRVVTEQLDNAGGIDLITLNTLSVDATVWIANFGASNLVPLAGAASDIGLVRCNGDVFPDFFYATGVGAGHGVTAHLGNGVATYVMSQFTAVPLPAGVSTLGVHGGRFDGDGFGDVAFSTTTNRLASATSAGNCFFFVQPLSFLGGVTSQPDVRDVDQDGELDVVAPHGSGSMSTAFGDGLGAFPTRIGVKLSELYAVVPPTINDLAPVDVTGDGILDYVAATSVGLHLFAGVP